MNDESVETKSRGIPPEKVRQLREMYEKFDADRDGSLDIRDLTRFFLIGLLLFTLKFLLDFTRLTFSALQSSVPHIPTIYAPRLLEKMAPYDKVGNYYC